MHLYMMNTPKRRVSLITLFLFPFAVVSIDNCSNSKCKVTSPFRTPDQPATCGLPGFDLSCNFPYKTPLLTFPSGKTFSVDFFYYRSIRLSDPKGCLQKKLLGLDPSGTPFGFKDPTYFPVYNCSRSKLPYPYNQNKEIKFLSGSNLSVFWDKYRTLSTYNACEFVGDAMGPRVWSPFYTYDFNDAVSVEMTWDLPMGCQLCNNSCQRSPYDPTRVTCPVSPPEKDNTARIVIPIVTTPILLALICVGMRICCQARGNRSQGGSRGTEQSNLNVFTSNTNRQSAVLPLGVEQDTLDAYPTIVVGVSGRILVNMEDKICPICLSEYAPKETLKTMPVCLHRFHSDCIDEWLRAKALCPVCRTPPPRRLS